jgi:hypothetical protein
MHEYFSVLRIVSTSISATTGWSFSGYGKIHPMIVAGTYPPINIDLGKDELGMTLQREYRESGYRVWRDYKIDGKVVNETPV